MNIRRKAHLSSPKVAAYRVVGKLALGENTLVESQRNSKKKLLSQRQVRPVLVNLWCVCRREAVCY